MKKIIVCLLVIILAIGYLVRPTLVLVAEDVNENKILFKKQIGLDFEFATLIRHSVQLTPVYEYYQIKNDGTLVVTGTVLQDLGWGMPSNLEYPVKFENNFLIMEHIDRPLEALYFRISYIAQPRLILDGQKIDLTKYSGDSHVIKIYVTKLPFIILKLRGEINVFQEKVQAAIIP